MDDSHFEVVLIEIGMKIRYKKDHLFIVALVHLFCYRTVERFIAYFVHAR